MSYAAILDKLKNKSQFADGGSITAKRGLVDGSGGYAGTIGRPKSKVSNEKEVRKLIQNRTPTTGVTVTVEGGSERSDGPRQPRIRIRTKKLPGVSYKPTFDMTLKGYEEAIKEAKRLSSEVSSQVKTRTEVAKAGNRTRVEYNNLKKEYSQRAIKWLDENASKPKYRKIRGGVELLQKDLVKAFNTPEYTKIPKNLANRSNTPFVQKGKINWPTNYEILPGITTSVNTKLTTRDLATIKLLETDNYKNLSLNLNDFYSGQKTKNKFSKSILNEMTFFSGKYLSNEGSIVRKYLQQRNYDFKNKIYDFRNFQTMQSRIETELNNPTISENRKSFLTKQLSQVRKNKNTVLKNLKNKYPSMFEKNSYVLEHRAAQAIGLKGATPFSKNFYLRAQYAPSAFNILKNRYLDTNLTSLISDYNLETDNKIKSNLKKEIQQKIKTFNNATKVKGKGYLDDIKFNFGNKIKITDNTPYVGSLKPQDIEKQIIKNTEHSNAFFKTLGNQKISLNNKLYNAKDFMIKIPKKTGASAVPALLTTLGISGTAALGMGSSEAEAATPKQITPGVTSSTGIEASINPAILTASSVPEIRNKFERISKYIPKPVQKGLGFLFSKVLPPAIVGSIGYDLATKSQYETPEDFALTMLQQPLDFIGAGGITEEIKRKGQLERYATPEEKEIIKQYYTPQYDVLGTDETDYIPLETSQEVKNRIEGIYDKYLRKEFGPAREFEPDSSSNIFVDTADQPFYIKPEAEKRYEQREKQGLESLGDIYGP